MLKVSAFHPGSVPARGALPLLRLSVVPTGQEGARGRLLVRQGDCAAVQPAGESRHCLLSVARGSADSAKGPTPGEMDQCGRGERD